MERVPRLILAAGSAASDAAAVLVRTAYEGQSAPAPFGDDDPIEQLLDAAKLAIEATTASGDFLGSRGRIYAALVKHLEGGA